MKPAPWTALALAIAVTCFLGHANPVAHIPLAVLLFPAGLVLLAHTAPDPKAAFRRGLLTAWAGYAACLYWVAVPVHDYAYLPWALALPCPVLLSAYLALYPAAFCWLMRKAVERISPLWLGLVAGLVWGALELGVETILTGFPWLPLVSGFGSEPWALPLVSIFGSFGLAGLLVMAVTWLTAPSAPRWCRGLGVTMLGFWAAMGLGGVIQPPATTGSALVGVVQGNIDQSRKWNPAYQVGTVERYAILSKGLLAEYPTLDLLVWPETAMPFFMQDPSGLTDMVRALALDNGVPIITGSPAYGSGPADGNTLFNRAYLVSANGGLNAHYDKAHLVPFGEYAPLSDILPIDKLVEGVGDFAPGRNPRPLRTGRLASGMLICYEIIFPELAWERVAHGANLLVNISNDAWFGRTSAPVQHLHQASLRAVEFGRWVVRSTNTGISGFIDPAGRVHTPTPLYRATAKGARVGLADGQTVYGTYFTHIRWTWLAAAALAAMAIFRPKRTL